MTEVRRSTAKTDFGRSVVMNFTALHTSTGFASTNVAERDIDLLTKARAGSNAAFEEIQRVLLTSSL